MGASGSMPSPQLLEEYSQSFRLLSEPARLQLLFQLQRAGLVRCERDGVRTIWTAEGELVDKLCSLVQTRLKQRLEHQLSQLQAA
jgi:hypothetical protein